MDRSVFVEKSGGLTINREAIVFHLQVVVDELSSLYGDSRAKGFGHEVKLRILKGPYALSAGYYEAYYKRAHQVRTIIQKSLKVALEDNVLLFLQELHMFLIRLEDTYGNAAVGRFDR